MGRACVASRLAIVYPGRRHAGGKWPSHHLSLYPATVHPVGNTRTTRSRGYCLKTRASLDDKAEESNSQQQQQQQQLNLSVLRFTLGIPGLDESYLPRWLGLAFGSLILLNHFYGSPDSPTPAQLRSESLGMCLAVFSVVLPYFGKFLKGATPVDRSILPQGNKQIFFMSENLSDIQKEDLAWGSYVMLRNTNTMAVLISVQGALCIRGYWNTPEDSSEVHLLDWFRRQIQQIGFSDLKESLYFPITTDFQLGELLPKGTLSLLLEPVLGVSYLSDGGTEKVEGFVLLASSASYAYRDKDRAWIKAVSKKFRGLIDDSQNGD